MYTGLLVGTVRVACSIARAIAYSSREVESGGERKETVAVSKEGSWRNEAMPVEFEGMLLA